MRRDILGRFRIRGLTRGRSGGVPEESSGCFGYTEENMAYADIGGNTCFGLTFDSHGGDPSVNPMADTEPANEIRPYSVSFPFLISY